MCGLAGIFGSIGPDRTRRAVERMLEAQTHRGPDAAGVWCGTIKGIDAGVGLRRLKILDLSDAANQPMSSEDGRFILVFNGEIYNYVELRKELEASGVGFRTQGDTEVLLKALIHWGPAAFDRLNGMWAVAFIDSVSGEILLSRDRFGIKPLYFHSDDSGLLIASEIKAILEVAGKKFSINSSTANAYLRQSILCASSATFFSGIEEFPAGHYCRIFAGDVGKRPLQFQRYWTIPLRSQGALDQRALAEEVRETFIDAVRIRLRSDVAVGVLLSGGVDSSSIAAAVHHLAPGRSDIRLISAVGSDGEPDEQPFIDLTANHLKRTVDKVVLDYGPSQAFDLIGEVSWFNDEPIGSFATVAHYLLMKRARELGVTVLLSGQGADESLCGYRKYLGFYVQQLVFSGHWLAAGRILRSFFHQGTVLSQFNYQDAKRYLPHWLRFPEIDVRGPSLLDGAQPIHVGLNGGGVIERQAIDVEKLSVPSLVHYEDRMSMALGREIRLPFLDYRFVSLLLPLAVEFKLRDGWTKWIFRRAMESMLPEEVAWRKDKQHFIVPQMRWLKCELRENMQHLIGSEWVSERLGLLDRKKFSALYQAYLHQAQSGGRIGVKQIMAPVAIELWARRFEPFLASA